MIFMAQHQTFGGDDDGSGQQQPQQVKKLDLKKYASKPDMNIRDLFWDIIAAYAMKQRLKKEELDNFQHERIALVRIALNVIENPKSAYFGIGRNLTALYSLMFMLDAEWEDAAEELILKSYEENNKTSPQMVAAINKISEDEKYREQIKTIFKELSRDHLNMEATLAYLSKVNSQEILATLKKELVIIAKSDIEKNQQYAMATIARIMDPEAKGVLINLLMHWDSETRKNAITLLKNEKDPKIAEIASRQLSIESVPGIKKALAKLVEKNKVG